MKVFFRRPNAARGAWLLAVLVVGAFLTWWQVRQADCAMRASLLESARVVGQAVDVNSLRTLSGTAADLKKPEYLRLKDQLAATRDANPQCRFIYLMGRRADGAIFFFVDSEPAGSKDCSPAGQVYEEASAGCRRVFALHEGGIDGPISDRWGTWVSGLVPILDQQMAQPGTGSLVAVLGMDINASAWSGVLARAALPSVLLTLALAAVLLLGSALLDRRARLGGEPPRWMRHVETAMAVAAGLVLTLFATWVVHNREAGQRIRTFEQMADSQTSSVVEMLRGIRDSELNGLARFCESNKLTAFTDFEKYTSSLTKTPAVQAWAWVPAVPAADKSSFENAVQAAGGGEFGIWRENGLGLRVPASHRQIYYPVLWLSPREPNLRVLGYDLGSEPLMNAAIEAATATELVTATEPVALLQDAGGNKNMLVWHSVFDVGESKSLRGFALAVLRMDLLLRKAPATSAVLLELSLLRNNARPELLVSNFAGNIQPASAISVTRLIFAFGKVFAVTASPGPGFPRQTGAGWLAALAGLCITASLATVISLAGRRQVNQR